MQDGFIKIACVTPEIKVADCHYNAKSIIKKLQEAHDNGAKLAAFPELSVTGYTCGDLFFQKKLVDSAKSALLDIISASSKMDIIGIVGLPFIHQNKLYNCAAVFHKGSLLALVPKKNIPNYWEFYEQRHFQEGFDLSFTQFYDKTIPIGTNIIFQDLNVAEFSFAVEICEDLWVPDSPSINHALNGALLIANISASDEIVGKADYRRTIIKAKSGTLLCAYIYADAGFGESTTDMVFGGHNIIAENGAVLAESNLLSSEIIYSEIDFQKLMLERTRMNTFKIKNDEYHKISFSIKPVRTQLTRRISPTPFVPSDNSDLSRRCREILKIQAMGLASRIRHIGCKSVVLGLSGGLDSTLALIVAVHAFDSLNLDRKNIIAVTMPCFGTTNRTYSNAASLADAFGVSFMDIDIKNSVIGHFKDIQHDENIKDITYENSQARERTQVLMDLANKFNAIVIGTGDLSELALGWATYNGDHMSMYAVNSSIPKTLVRYLIDFEAEHSEQPLKGILQDISATPVSPELLPPAKDGSISQKTEDIVGPYELHDFFLYYMVRFGFSPSKIFRLAECAFENAYSSAEIAKWLKTFYLRFFSQQFKRSCLPDGPKVGTVTLSPRADFRMPSDASADLWMHEIEHLIS